MTSLRTLLVSLVGSLAAAPAVAANPREELLAAYATRPQGYPTGATYASPDTSVPFRWHFYHDDAIPRHEDARTVPHVEPFNSLEGRGAAVAPKSAVKLAFGTDHVTEGKQSLKVEFPAAAVRDGTAVVHIHGIAGPKLYQDATAACYWSNYRWLKFDVFNPAAGNVRVRVGGVPFVLRPGANVVAVKTADLVGDRGAYPAVNRSVSVAVTSPAADTTLFIDNVRMEQEVPELLARRGRMLQFAARMEGKAENAACVWPGLTAVGADTEYAPERGHGWTEPLKGRTIHGGNGRSTENGILWGWCEPANAPFRIDLPNGRYGLWLFATPGYGFDWSKGATAKVNGKPEVLFAPRTEAELRRVALAGEAWDFRPGACVWENLVRQPYYPPARVVYVEVKDKRLVFELPPRMMLRAVMAFPAGTDADEKEGLKEIGRFNALLAESWDVAHPWVKAEYADRGNYVGRHEEMIHPERIPEKLKALDLTDADYRRGFVVFRRGLTEAVYPDSIPTTQEVAAGKLQTFTTPGERATFSFGVLPLDVRKGLRVTAGELKSKDGGRIPAAAIDLRFARYHQKCMEYGHHNHAYNYQPHFLVRRPALDLYPGAARRAYLEVAVPADARPGEYSGEVTLADADGRALATMPLALEVLPFRLDPAAVYFATDRDDPRLTEYGLNTFLTANYDDAAKKGYKGFMKDLSVYPSVTVKDKKIDWNNFLANKELLKPLLAAGRAGDGPRAFLGGLAPNTYSKPAAERAKIADRFFGDVLTELPQTDILGRTLPVYFFEGPWYTWGLMDLPVLRTKGKPELLEKARDGGKEFWFADWVRHGKEQSARFTFGVWLWRLGASGRLTDFTYGGDYGYGTAKQSYRTEPYYTLCSIVTCNIAKPSHESLVEGEFNTCRDLVLIREGTLDFRYLAALDARIKKAGDKGGPALAAAKKFRDDLAAELSLDLSRYYTSRTADYSENWEPLLDNPWTGEKFARVRRACADHILALDRARE